MSKPHPTESEHRQSDLAVMDANEYKQKQRLREVLEARRNVEATMEIANERLAGGQITEDGRNVAVLNAVQKYLRECWNLVRRYDEEHFAWDDEAGKRVLKDPEQYYDGDELREDELPIDWRYGIEIGHVPIPHGEDVAIVGLEDVLYADEVYADRWETTESRRHGPDETVQHEQAVTVPLEVSLEAYRAINEFLDEEHNLDLAFEEESLPEHEL